MATLTANPYRNSLRAEIAAVPELKARKVALSAEIAEVRKKVERGETWPSAPQPLEREWRELTNRINHIENNHERELLDGCGDADLIERRRRLRVEREAIRRELTTLGHSASEERERASRLRAENDGEAGQKIKAADPKTFKRMAKDAADAETLAADIEAAMRQKTARLAEVDAEIHQTERDMIAA